MTVTASPPASARPGKAVKGIQNSGAIGRDAGNQHPPAAAIKEPDGEIELCGRKVRGNQRKNPRAPSAIMAEAAASSKHIHSIELDSSCWAWPGPSCSLTRINVGTAPDSSIRRSG